MAQLPFDQAIARLQQNEDRLDAFTNNTGTMTTSGGQSVKTIRTLSAEFQAVIDAAAATPAIEGNDGWTPVFALVADGSRIVLQVSDWTGGEGTKPASGKYVGNTGFVDAIASARDLRGPQGLQGTAGTNGTNGTNGSNGNNGWSPQLAVVSDGERRVLQVADWTGGAGTKPAAGQYVGASGLVATAALAIDIRGAAGSSAAQLTTPAIIAGTSTTPGSVSPDQLKVAAQTFGDALPANTQLTRWKAALARAKAGGGNAKMVMLGNSWVNGSGASGTAFYGNNDRKFNFTNKLASMLNGFYASTRFDSFFGAGNITTNYGNYDSRVVLTGTWTQGLTALPNTIGGSLFSNTNASTLSITPENTFDSYEVYYATAATQGTFDIAIDGSTVGSVNASAANGIAKYTGTTSLGAHTLRVTKTNASNNNILGFRFWNSALPQIEIIQAGSSGALAALFTNTAQPWEAKNQITYLAADLVYFECTINDAVAGTSIATFKANVQSVIDTVKAAGGDIILGTGGPFDITYAPGVALATQRSYVTAIQDLAILNNCPFVNMFAEFVSYEISNPAGLYTDQLHANYNGYERYAKKLFGLLAAV